mmetsp:Transcript_4153/g.10665  ORF Transcript_4153/g.10665 Transcript_4153/m.10665 type:complete len:143 (+) Transcript_4153:82-510(+)|eukprot:CAMPEP_0198234524 /NCGR_PEP_ID=MMETSP1446-20131203/525_1 /TAXON_ID=1461542 ORGANISM="Unidentified sp, Strain CCMP2111" /NCGR_SAMPLE_ID=MMETSP1446 /ASSEMBLY_ACC=CAM_ASM_001112 /LENGTH=142 /DNA_ID=CAMNT_0043915319 /DNA_START=63 /DNA_END=491 /DNA_ORIENTATION=-
MATKMDLRKTVFTGSFTPSRVACKRRGTHVSARRRGGGEGRLGFYEKDSAGQSNIFAVEPSVYVQSKSDGGNSAIGLLVGLLVFGGVGALVTAKLNKPVEVDADLTYLLESGKSVSMYEQRFESVRAPVVVEDAQEAPALAE